jgi:hypothetical protein
VGAQSSLLDPAGSGELANGFSANQQDTGTAKTLTTYLALLYQGKKREYDGIRQSAIAFRVRGGMLKVKINY